MLRHVFEPGPPPPPATVPDPVEPASPPTPPDQPRAYELPSARKVVGSGLQLALASTSDLRRASIYIGLLVLGAFGPTVVGVLLIFGRLGDRAGDALTALFLGGYYGARPQPALEAAILVVSLEALVGILLFLAISVDAQVMGIAILGSRAGERPLRMWEALTRARQTFWRVTGAGAVVGVASTVIQLLIVTAIGGLSQSAEAADVVAAIIATIVIAPLAYVSTSIVLGDVGAMEALSRSWRLFRVRPRLAVVVVLFTLVTSAIQLFALSAGLDLVTRAGELLHVSLTAGAVSFLIAVALVLAAVVAYGSLTFTIGAVVAAPQVAGFLGLTFYSGGLDRARSAGAAPPRGFRYVTHPMAIAMVALAGVVALEIPAINSIPAPLPSAALELVRTAAASESDLIDVNGYPEVLDDPIGDGSGPNAAEVELIGAESAYVERVPEWLLDRFNCDRDDVACTNPGNTGFEFGAYLFLHHIATPVAPGDPRRFAVLLAMENEVPQIGREGDPFKGASRVFVTTPSTNTVEQSRSDGAALLDGRVHVRSLWDGTSVYTLVSASDLPDLALGWDVEVLRGSGGTQSIDTLRATPQSRLRSWEPNATIFIDDVRDVP